MPLPLTVIEKNFSIKIPAGYHKKDFYKIIQKISDFTKMQVDGGVIRMGCIMRNFIVEKSGREFGIQFFSLLGAVRIIIVEISKKNIKEWMARDPIKVKIP